MTSRHIVQWIRCNKIMQWFNISLGQIGRKSVQNTTQYVNELMSQCLEATGSAKYYLRNSVLA